MAMLSTSEKYGEDGGSESTPQVFNITQTNNNRCGCGGGGGSSGGLTEEELAKVRALINGEPTEDIDSGEITDGAEPEPEPEDEDVDSGVVTEEWDAPTGEGVDGGTVTETAIPETDGSLDSGEVAA